MADWYLGLALLLLINFLVGLIAAFRGRSPADRLLAMQLFDTTTVAVILLLAESQVDPASYDVALLLALLAAVTGVAFVRLPLQHQSGARKR